MVGFKDNLNSVRSTSSILISRTEWVSFWDPWLLRIRDPVNDDNDVPDTKRMRTEETTQDLGKPNCSV